MNKAYNEYVDSLSNNITGREDVEWSNFWYDKANTNVCKRILLVGDSTARMVRSKLSKEIALPVDLFATSSGLHDALFCKQIDAFFRDEMKYLAIFVQLGNHSRLNDEGLPYRDEDFAVYKKDLSALVSYLKQYSDTIILETIFYCVKPLSIIPLWFERITRLKIEKWDEEINCNTRGKNEIIKQLSNELGVPLLDINEIMIQKNYMRTDHIHFEKRALPTIVKAMCEQLPNFK